jgi:hypothetical protein
MLIGQAGTSVELSLIPGLHRLGNLPPPAFRHSITLSLQPSQSPAIDLVEQGYADSASDGISHTRIPSMTPFEATDQLDPIIARACAAAARAEERHCAAQSLLDRRAPKVTFVTSSQHQPPTPATPRCNSAGHLVPSATSEPSSGSKLRKTGRAWGGNQPPPPPPPSTDAGRRLPRVLSFKWRNHHQASQPAAGDAGAPHDSDPAQQTLAGLQQNRGRPGFQDGVQALVGPNSAVIQAQSDLSQPPLSFPQLATFSTPQAADVSYSPQTETQPPQPAISCIATPPRHFPSYSLSVLSAAPTEPDASDVACAGRGGGSGSVRADASTDSESEKGASARGPLQPFWSSAELHWPHVRAGASASSGAASRATVTEELESPAAAALRRRWELSCSVGEVGPEGEYRKLHVL